MLIAIDESGTFVPSAQSGSWCVVAAYTFAERRKTAALKALLSLKKKYHRSTRQEAKLRDIKESDYFAFLTELMGAGGVLFAAATDTSLTMSSEIRAHRAAQAQNIRANVHRMRFDEGKRAAEELADGIDGLSTQLYAQLMCQTSVLSAVLKRAILYFVQRDPVTLRRFIWRIDQKNTTKTSFENVFEHIAPGLLQSRSFREPFYFLEGADYSHFSPYEFSEDEFPNFLVEEFGYMPQPTVNIGKLLRKDMQFPDSRDDLSIQIADLLASGIRRCLRGGFSDNKKAAILLGKLMIQDEKPKPPISLVRFSSGGVLQPDKTAKSAVLRMKAHARPMMLE